MITKSISEREAYDLSFKITYSSEYDLNEFESHSFKTDVSTNLGLYALELQYRSFKKRYAFNDIQDFLNNDNPGKVLILYGLRRTGKTTLIFQSLMSLSLKEHSKAAFIRINRDNKYDDLKDDLNYLTTHGFKYIFIDEVTLLNNFISISSVFSDIFGTRSKIILSGTDSLGLYIAKYDELFDRAIFIHTTYIPYNEFSEVLGIDSLDKYIEYGGTMSLETNRYNNTPLSDDNYQDYIDSAIANNITHSLKNYNSGDHFSSLYELYEKGELKNVINRVIEDQNHRFAISVIDKEFKSNDLGSLKDLLSKSIKEDVSNALDGIDEKKVIDTLRHSLEIINKNEQTVTVTDSALKEIENYLDILDVIKSVKEINMLTQYVSYKHVIVQPGIRYSQAKELLYALLDDEHVKKLPSSILAIVKEKLLNDIKGRLLEEIVLYQTSTINKNTFKLIFPVGEFDMVINDDNNAVSSIFEIKHTIKADQQQCKHLIDKDKISQFEKKYYNIKNKIVLYNGENHINGEIYYMNVSHFLKNTYECMIMAAIEQYIDRNKDLFYVESSEITNIWNYLYYFAFISKKSAGVIKPLDYPKEKGLLTLADKVFQEEKVSIDGKIYDSFISYLSYLQKAEKDSVYNKHFNEPGYYFQPILIEKCVKDFHVKNNMRETMINELIELCNSYIPVESQNDAYKHWISSITKRYF
jgi:hypothetical protein